LIAVVYSLRNEVSDLMREMEYRPLNGWGKMPRVYESSKLKNAILVEGGIGRDRAEAATRTVIAELKPKAVLSTGFAGGARQTVGLGEVVLCKRLFSHVGPPALWTSAKPLELKQPDDKLFKFVAESLRQAKIKHRIGDSLSTMSLVSDPETKKMIGIALEVDIVEMESYWVCKAASESGIPAIAIRVVLDTSGEDLPPFVAQSVESNGKGSVLKAIRYVAVNPFRAASLTRLARQSRQAQKALSSALISALNGLQTWEGASAKV